MASVPLEWVLPAFHRIVSKAVGKGLQPYDTVFMMRIFDRVVRHFGSVAICDMVAVLILVAVANVVVDVAVDAIVALIDMLVVSAAVLVFVELVVVLHRYTTMSY